MTSHIHAASMALYALDAAETDKPWERWEFRVGDAALPSRCETHPTWDEKTQYRRLASYSSLGHCSVPRPLWSRPKVGTRYFVATTDHHDYSQLMPFIWSGDGTDKLLLRRGLCHLTAEAAQKHAEALIAVYGGIV